MEMAKPLMTLWFQIEVGNHFRPYRALKLVLLKRSALLNQFLKELPSPRSATEMDRGIFIQIFFKDNAGSRTTNTPRV